MSRNFLTIGGIGAAGALGYYFYLAGGNPQEAQKHFKQDVAQLQQKAPEGGKSAQDIGAKIDEGIQKAKDQGKSAQQSLNSYSKDAQQRLEDTRKSTGNELMKGVDKFDKTVEEGAAQAKSGISSWFGGGK